jgi:hypothetical protein
MRCDKDRNLLKTWIFKSTLPQSISSGAGHALEIQIVKHQYVRNAWFACCVLSHVPSRWPFHAWCDGGVHGLTVPLAHVLAKTPNTR